MIKKTLLLLMLLTHFNLSASEFCSTNQVNQDISGKWEGSDSYYLIFSVNKKKQLCISMKDNYANYKFFIKDIQIVNGKLKSFAYASDNNTYTIYSHIEIKGKVMNFNWYSSYMNNSGKDTYYKK